jgi:hypothetical protein
VLQTDASFVAAGGVWAAAGLYFQFPWPPAVRRAAEAVVLTINDLELAALVLAIGTLAAAGPAGPAALTRQAVLLRGDNVSSLDWATHGGGRGRVGNALAAYGGVLEAELQCSYLAEHVAGVQNVLPDLLSRAASAETLLAAARSDPRHLCAPLLAWQQVAVPAALASDVCAMLLSPSCSTAYARVRRWATRA